MTLLHDNPLTRSTDISKTQEGHKLEVNPDPEPSFPYSSSKTSSTYSRSKKKKRNENKCVVSIRKMTRQNHLRATIMILPRIEIIDANDAKRRKTEKGSDQIMHNFNVKVAGDSI